MQSWVLRKQYRWAGATASPEYSLVNSSAPADSKPKAWTSDVWVEIFVVRGCMSCSHRQLPASCAKYHWDQDGLSILGRRWPIRIRPLYVCLQYKHDMRPKTLDVRVGA